MNSAYRARLDSPLSQPTIASTTYSLNFSVKNVRSGVKIDSNE